jgi:hypothetical protein
MGQSEAHVVGVEFGYGDRLAIDDEQIALGRIDSLVHVHGEREDHVIGVERMTVGKSNASPKLEGESPAVR